MVPATQRRNRSRNCSSERTPMHAPTQLATAMLRVSEIEGQRRRTTAARRSLAKELDEDCHGAGYRLCSYLEAPEFDTSHTPSVGSEYVHDDDGGVWEPVEFGIGELLCIV